MLDIAKQIGMPTEFVALRHEATHEELPAIQRLVKATEDGLVWLWNVHWSGLDEPETEQSVAKLLPEVKAQAREIFKTYRGSRREALKSKKPKDQAGETRATSKALSSLMDASRWRMQAVADVLVEDKLLVPSKREYVLFQKFLEVNADIALGWEHHSMARTSFGTACCETSTTPRTHSSWL